MSKSSFPETASTNEWARFLYYTGQFLLFFESVFSFHYVKLVFNSPVTIIIFIDSATNCLF